MTKKVSYKITSVIPNLLKWTDSEGLVVLIGDFFTEEHRVQRTRRTLNGQLGSMFWIPLGDLDSHLWLSLQWIGLHANPLRDIWFHDCVHQT